MTDTPEPLLEGQGGYTESPTQVQHLINDLQQKFTRELHAGTTRWPSACCTGGGPHNIRGLMTVWFFVHMFDLDKQRPESRADALHVVFQDGKLISDMRSHRPCVLTDSDLTTSGWQVRREQFIGHWQARPCFALEIDDLENIDPMRHRVGSLYEMLGRVDDAQFALASRALQLLAWQRDHQFCGRCGNPMAMLDEERAMRCQLCETSVYPRISPCIIVLVTQGEHLLLARHTRYRRPMYSTLAGFIEAGENAEQCLEREVHEEVGLRVRDVRYSHSQSWPFPGQLMLGYFASYESGEIRCDPREIAEADWYHYSDLPPTPPATSIAGQLIRHYVAHASTPKA